MKIVIVVGLLVVGLSLFSWWMGRRINYSLMYKGFVRETIQETVRGECLK